MLSENLSAHFGLVKTIYPLGFVPTDSALIYYIYVCTNECVKNSNILSASPNFQQRLLRITSDRCEEC